MKMANCCSAEILFLFQYILYYIHEDGILLFCRNSHFIWILYKIHEGGKLLFCRNSLFILIYYFPCCTIHIHCGHLLLGAYIVLEESNIILPPCISQSFFILPNSNTQYVIKDNKKWMQRNKVIYIYIYINGANNICVTKQVFLL